MTRTNSHWTRKLLKPALECVFLAFVLTSTSEGYVLEFATEPQDTVVQNGHSAVLDCVVKTADHHQSAIVTQWLDQDHQALSFVGDNYRSQLTNGSLYISSVSDQHGLALTGAYQCKASLPGGASIVSRTAQLSLAALSNFIREPLDITVYRGQKAHFACRVHSVPPPQIRWLKDERPLKRDEVRMTFLPSGALEIDEVKDSDQGSYRCNVSGLNSNLLSNKANLIVEDDIDQSYALSAPTFIASPLPEVVVEGQTVTLDCAANGNPTPSIKWLKDGYAIDIADLDSRFNLVGSTSSLTIVRIQKEDEGTYQCRAENKEDSLDASAQIQVQVPPKFLKKPQHKTELVNKDVELECAVYGKPEPKVHWLKNGEHINMNEYYQLVNGNNLKIVGLMKSDTGLFQCVAVNAAGNVQAAASLTVIDGKSKSPKKPNKRKKTAQLRPNDETSRALFDILKSDSSSGSKLGDFNFGYSAPLKPFNNNNYRHGPYYQSNFSTLQNSDSNNNLGDTLTITDPFSSSKPYVGDDPGHILDGAPGPPQDLKALFIKARFIVLSWKPPVVNNDDIVTYSVYFRHEGSERERVQNTTRAKLEEINIGSLQPGKVYHFRVVAYNSLGMGASSETLAVTTQNEENVPSAPVDFEAYATSTRSIHVSWKAPEIPNGPILGYKIYYIEILQSMEHSVETKNTEFDIISLSVFSKYNVWVVALNSNGPGTATEEKVVQTFSDEPSEPPYNVTLEPASSTSIIVRWEPPPLEGQNGIITGYKLRYRIQGKKGSNTLSTAGNSRIYTLTGLERGSIYQVKLWALNINGTGPPTDWIEIETYTNDLDESRVPDKPGPLKVRPASDKLYVVWSPPENQNIKIRNYILGWGKGIPDIFSHELDEKQRQYIIPNLEANSEYVISLRASNEIGAGAPVYANVRTREEQPPDLISPLIPPVGLKAQVLSASSVILYWVDTTLSKTQFVRDNRYYVVEYRYTSGKVPKTRHVNVTNLNVMIDDLKPNTLYEFSVKVVKARRESPWSMVVTNTTWDVPPGNAPRDLNIQLAEDTQLVELSWQPPKQQSGHVTGYIILYTNDSTLRDRDWSAQAVKGDKHKSTLTDLQPSTKYFFKIQARNNRGNGPFSSVISFKTGQNTGFLPLDAHSKDKMGVFSGTTLLIIITVSCVVALVTGISLIAISCCRKRPTNTTPDRSKKGYQKGTQNVKPPDLWIHHDQMELKNMDKSHNNDGASSSGAMTLPRSVGTNDYDDRDTQHTNSLDKRTYVPNYMAIPNAPTINSSNLSQTSSDSTPSNRPSYPRTQYTISRAHVTLDQNPTIDSPYASHTSNYDAHNAAPPYINQVPPPIAHVPPSSTYAPGMSILAESQANKRMPGANQHPLKSFTVPAPPPISAPGTPQPKHVVRPNQSPYKKPPSSGSSTLTGTPPSRIASNPPPHNVEEVQRLKPSHSTEELNQEMANLEGLMLTLNAITANEFEC
ncbi:PREDICTED: neogenin isoform X2 [Nicrophorus vespilloides]|uniref:Neogenin isoform X2 n=1 Tax=Nicrophorus vespilloides TaxID=110193 RepID=A0ABM1NIE4_NICVS|nr:PREDICTED: neogenin isoform X2 [Nicrophorus vespilloides]